MTIRELAMNWIENADTATPTFITVAQAADYVGWMDKDSDLPEGLTPETFAEAWNDIIVELHGDDMTDAERIIANGQYDAAVALMDDGIREAVHADLAPCTDLEFLTEYMRRHEERFGTAFEVN